MIARLIGASVLRNIKLFVKGIWAGVQALRAMGIAGAATAIKIWAIVAAVVLIAAAIDDLIGFAQGRDSVIGRLLGDSKLGKELKKSLLDLFTTMKRLWAELKPAIQQLGTALDEAFGDLAELLAPVLWDIFIGSIHATILAIEILGTVISGVTNIIKWLPKAWDDANAGINKGLIWLEDRFKSVTGSISATWSNAVGEIMWVVNKLMAGLQKVIDLKNKVFGVEISGDISKARKTIEGAVATHSRPEVDYTSAGTPVLKGIMGPKFTGGPMDFSPNVPRFAGQGLQAHATVNSGAVQVTVNAKGDAKQIAGAVTAAVDKSIGKIFTSASRDLVKAPQGQR